MVLDKGGYYPLTYSVCNVKLCNVGCNVNGHLINHIMYADDLIFISPSSAGLSLIV